MVDIIEIIQFPISNDDYKEYIYNACIILDLVCIRLPTCTSDVAQQYDKIFLERVSVTRYATAEEASAAKSTLNGADLCGSSIVVDSWEKGRQDR